MIFIHLADFLEQLPDPLAILNIVGVATPDYLVGEIRATIDGYTVASQSINVTTMNL